MEAATASRGELAEGQSPLVLHKHGVTALAAADFVCVSSLAARNRVQALDNNGAVPKLDHAGPERQSADSDVSAGAVPRGPLCCVREHAVILKAEARSIFNTFL